MTTFHTDPCVNLPAPSDIELAAMDAQAKRPKFKPFVAVRWNRLVTIVAKVPLGFYRDTHGQLHQMCFLERDLDAYAERMRAECQDHHDTQQDALR